jgi:hypothetical protein
MILYGDNMTSSSIYRIIDKMISVNFLIQRVFFIYKLMDDYITDGMTNQIRIIDDWFFD